ncbi:NfeD family protein [Halioxenophilus sp. WMMB6]|uniref:NfeD family protein n=1 Tax=Halioxenophilus sp. WMMB6 TaxID=3073815 RepID=UPI00295EDFD6|nr:NfeD family protein [Halioxenophilus sp. WMMB6]
MIDNPGHTVFVAAVPIVANVYPPGRLCQDWPAVNYCRGLPAADYDHNFESGRQLFGSELLEQAAMEIVYWHWVVMGVALILSELALTTFFILWFGVAAIIVGGILLLWPQLPLTWQILLWTILSVILAFAWFKYLKPLSVDRTKAGLSREAILGEIGQVILLPNAERRGRMRFPVPILGDDEWLIIVDEGVAIGDRVRVVDVVGNALVVEKV